MLLFSTCIIACNDGLVLSCSRTFIICIIKGYQKSSSLVSQIMVYKSQQHVLLIIWRPLLSSGHSDAHGWASECPGVKNFKRRLNPVWPRLLCSCTHMATVGVEGLNKSYSCCVSTVRRCGGRLSLNSQGEACIHMAPWGGGVIGPSASTDDAHWITNRAILNSNCIGLYPGSTAFCLRFISLAASTGGALNTFLLRYIISHRAW